MPRASTQSSSGSFSESTFRDSIVEKRGLTLYNGDIIIN
jgi:hypothetical protein